ncbi:hypothetical protein NIES4101_74120 [Calothrix sp. NIES-4101]|nr:hypothetical protein NIES4101_74120 [Calothrix sp. NIES-4101]
MSDFDLIQHLMSINTHLQILQSARPSDRILFEISQQVRSRLQELLNVGEVCRK